ncbi:unnamed protein product [Sphagnum troendelagicum]|uniref:Uncharacterized protein n=1 Tax=Sphagnum troendelagicum TaxID=128251 RepID=A0ABP0T933_9BRYO
MQTSRGAGRGGGALAASTIPVTAMFNSMVLEEQMHKMLWGWKAELQAVPASSLLAETSSLESIDTWSGFAVKMMRKMML